MMKKITAENNYDQKHKGSRSNRKLAFALVLSCSVLSLLTYNSMSITYRHEFALGILALALLIFSSEKTIGSSLRSAALLLGTLLALTATAEAYLTLSAPRSFDADTTLQVKGAMFTPHKTLGYVPQPSSKIPVSKTYNNPDRGNVYDVIYTIDNHSRRVSTNAPKGLANCILFFGGSYTLGEGVHDYESMPAQFAALSEHKIEAINFGFSGYGAHHMLRSVEDGSLSTACDGKILATIYTALPSHHLRSAGLVFWGPTSPSYTFEKNTNQIVYNGARFKSLEEFQLFSNLRTSALIKTVWDLAATPDALLSYREIVKSASEKITAATDAPFVILYWNNSPTEKDRQLSNLKEDGHHIIMASDFLSSSQMANMRIPGDGHPTAEAYTLIAIGLLDRLCNKIAPDARACSDKSSS